MGEWVAETPEYAADGSAEKTADPAADGSEQWIEYADDEGHSYWYNTYSQESTYEYPYTAEAPVRPKKALSAFSTSAWKV